MQELPPLLQRVAEIKQRYAQPDQGEIITTPTTDEEVLEKLQRFAIYSAIEGAS